jgi:iron complex outermembrane recepter protein
MAVRAVLLFCTCMLALTAPATAEESLSQVSISAGPLPECLQSLERQTGIELLVDHDAINGLHSPAVEGTLTAETALKGLLADTDLAVRRAKSGAWIVERPAAPLLAQPDAAVPEILVVGQRTQDADIRRFANDIQPYLVATQQQILDAHRDNLGQYFDSRVTSNAMVPVNPAGAGNSSSVDLRGLGLQDTLVLIDGRRMPNSMLSGQTDLNAIPLHAIDRIEVLTGAAGGIYGFGALGGVINVVLDRDTRGLQLHATEGVTSRGDARRQAVEAGLGHTSADGQTDFTLFASYSKSDSVLVGARDFAVRDRELNQQNFGVMSLLPQPLYGNSITVVSFDPVLTFKPQYGGATLNSARTYLPAGFSGDPTALVASLTQHAGQVDFSQAAGEAESDLGSNPRTESLFVNLRHRFGEFLEAYVDAVVLWNRAESNNRSSGGEALIGTDSPVNPFNDDVTVYFPISGMNAQTTKSAEADRYTVGLEATLPYGWRGTAESILGSFRYNSSETTDLPNQLLFLFGDPSDLKTNPFGNWNTFQRAITSNLGHLYIDYAYKTQLHDDSLRLAGPLFRTSAGTATLTLLAEHRVENFPAYTSFDTVQGGGSSIVTPSLTPSNPYATKSQYAELRAPLFDQQAAIPVRGLELQLAARRDDEWLNFDLQPAGGAPAGRADKRFIGTAYTAGAKSTPWSWLMVRASYATGQQPPPLDGLIGEFDLTTTGSLANDPERKGQPLGSAGALAYRLGGDENLGVVESKTLFLGVVLTPRGQDGPSLAVDYSRIRKSGDVYAPSADVVLAHASNWPQRVVRAPLTAADQAQGFTGGRVLLLDLRDTNGAGLDVEALDAHAAWPLPLFGGRLRLYAEATYHMSNLKTSLFEPNIQSAGYQDGPLKWRANAGFDWSSHRWSIGANVQYFGRSLVLESGPLGIVNPIVLQAQGSDYIPSQTYLDLNATWRLPIPHLAAGHEPMLSVGIIDVLDASPPRLTSIFNMGPGYSLYGDPRQRRFELMLSQRF